MCLQTKTKTTNLYYATMLLAIILLSFFYGIVSFFLIIFSHVGVKLSEFPTKEEEVLTHLNETGVAERIANQYLIDTEFGVRAHVNKMKRRQRDLLMAQEEEGKDEEVKRDKKGKKPVKKDLKQREEIRERPQKKKK